MGLWSAENSCDLQCVLLGGGEACLEHRLARLNDTTRGLAALQHTVGMPIQGSMLRVLMLAQEGYKMKSAGANQENAWITSMNSQHH